MVSASEQLARNMSFGSFAKAKELQQRLLFTLLILVVYRIGTFVPVPGVDLEQFAQLFQGGGNGGGFVDRLNMFAGGAVERMAIFALNVMPYITASIIMTLMKGSIPKLIELDKDGQQGRQQINQYTRYLTLVLAAFQAFGVAKFIEASGAAIDPGFFFQVSTVLTLVGGTMFLMWMGEQITARGVGNGVSLIIFAGIVAELPKAIVQAFQLQANEAISSFVLLAIVAMFIALAFLIVFVERAQRRLLVQYPKRMMAGGRQAGGNSSFLPLKLNTAGVIPPIFASSLLILPVTAAGFMAGGGAEAGAGFLGSLQAYIGYGRPLYLVLYAALIIFFCYFYVPYVFKPDDVADNLRKNGGFLPGIRPGKRTADYLSYVLSRLTFIGALYVAFVCVLPEWAIARVGNLPFSVAMLIGGMSLLIIVSVTLDTVAQIQSHLIAHQYEGLVKKSRMRRRAAKKTR